MGTQNYVLHDKDEITIQTKTYSVNRYSGGGRDACSQCDFFLFPLDIICDKIECEKDNVFYFLTSLNTPHKKC